jgi:hypothetical protein
MSDGSVVTSARYSRQARAGSLNTAEMSSQVDYGLVLHERSNKSRTDYILEVKFMLQKSNKERTEGFVEDREGGAYDGGCRQLNMTLPR